MPNALAGSDVGIGSSASGGGGVTASNYLAVVNTSLQALTTTAAVVGGLEAYEGEGGTYLAISGDTNSLKVLTAGIYVVNIAVDYGWGAQALGVTNYFYSEILFTTADGNSLAINGNWIDTRTYNETQTPVTQVQGNLTTPPMALAVNDTFQVKAKTLIAPTAGTSPQVTAEGLILTGVRIG
jgi:hypothetical protein